MSLYRFARGAAIGTVGFLAGYYASDDMRNRKFKVHAIRPKEPVQPNTFRNIEIEKESLIVEQFEISGDTSEERNFSKFSAMYDRSRKTSNYVLELLSWNNMQDKPIPKRKNKFKEDMKIYHVFRSTLEDYKNKNGEIKSTLERGHLASVGNYPNDEKAREETFILSNIVPQNSSVNKKIIGKFEKYVRELLPKNEYVTVCSGPLYIPRDIHFKKYKKCCADTAAKILYDDEYEMVKNTLPEEPTFMIHRMSKDVSVPTHFFKVIISEKEIGDPVIEAFLVKNAPAQGAIKLENFKVPVEDIERRSGYTFTDGYIREKAEEMKENTPNTFSMESLFAKLGGSNPAQQR